MGIVGVFCDICEKCCLYELLCFWGFWSVCSGVLGEFWCGCLDCIFVCNLWMDVLGNYFWRVLSFLGRVCEGYVGSYGWNVEVDGYGWRNVIVEG